MIRRPKLDTDEDYWRWFNQKQDREFIKSYEGEPEPNGSRED